MYSNHICFITFGAVIQEVDEDAPAAWKRIYSGSTPVDIYETLTESDQEAVEKWRQHRSTLIQQRVQEEVEAELETQSSMVRESAPFLRIRVHSVSPREEKTESGLLTIWHPTEEQINCLKEGTCIQIFDAGVRDTLHDGLLQLTASKRTVIESFDLDPNSLVTKIGYEDRRYLTMVDVHMLSHNTMDDAEEPEQTEFDVAGVCCGVTESSKAEEQLVLHLIDESCLTLRIHLKAIPYNLKVILEGEEESPALALRDLRLRAFNTRDRCAVAEFTDLSSVVVSNGRIDELADWVVDEGSVEVLSTILRLDTTLVEWEQITEDRVTFGYVMGLRFEEDSQQVFVLVDCCGAGCREWELPLNILQGMVSKVSLGNEHPVHNPLLEARVLQLGMLGTILQRREILWEFHMSFDVSDASSKACIVTSAVTADIALLSHYYLALEALPDTGKKNA